MKPVNTLILVEFEEEKEVRTETGIYIQKSAENNALGFLRSGKVLAVNRKEETEEKDIKVGDTVYFNKNAVCYIPTAKNQVFVRKEDVYGVE